MNPERHLVCTCQWKINNNPLCEVVVLLSLMIQLQVKDCLSHSSKGLVQVFADVTSSGGTKSHPSKSLDKFGLVCLAAGFESQMSLLSSLEKFEGKVKLPGKESSEVVITELVRANQGFGSSKKESKKSKLYIWSDTYVHILSIYRMIDWNLAWQVMHEFDIW